MSNYVIRNIGGTRCLVTLGVKQKDVKVEDGSNLEVNKLNLPVFGSIELTGKCNLKCVHCYATTERVKTAMGKEVIIKIIEDLANMGCLFLQLTGGECTSRSDFLEIYEFAYRKGIMITVSTNGTLINDEIIDSWKKHPPYRVFVSLYGSNAVLHEKVTLIKGSFEKTISGLEKMKESGVNVFINCMAVKTNVDDLHSIKLISKNLGIKVFFYGKIVNRLDGDSSPLNLAISKQEVKDKLPKNTGRTKILGTHQEYKGTCLAGFNSFHIDCEGNLMPCKMVRRQKFKITEGRFEEQWHLMSNELPHLKKIIKKDCVMNVCEL